MENMSEQLWLNLWKRIGAEGNAHAIYKDIVRRYSESHRAYHNLNHIKHCLNEFEKVRHLAKNPDAIEFAIWYHDAIYDTHANDNEERSADLAKEVCIQLRLPAWFTDKVRALILSSKHNHGNPEDLDEQTLTDVDLSSFGKPWEEFKKDSDDIRFEYSWVPENIFMNRRKEILQEFFSRLRIYNTDYFYGRYEALARQNISRSIEQINARYK